MSSNQIKINLSNLVNITLNVMKENQIADLTNKQTSRRDLSNIWNLISFKMINEFNYFLSLKIYKKWHENNSKYAFIVKKKIKEES